MAIQHVGFQQIAAGNCPLHMSLKNEKPGVTPPLQPNEPSLTMNKLVWTETAHKELALF